MAFVRCALQHRCLHGVRRLQPKQLRSKQLHASVASFRNWHTVCVMNTVCVYASLCAALQCAESEKTTSGGVLLANDSGDKPNLGTVVAVGEGRKDEEGKTTAPNVAVGATVMYSKYSGTEFEVRRLGAVCVCGGGGGGVPWGGGGGEEVTCDDGYCRAAIGLAGKCLLT